MNCVMHCRHSDLLLFYIGGEKAWCACAAPIKMITLVSSLDAIGEWHRKILATLFRKTRFYVSSCRLLSLDRSYLVRFGFPSEMDPRKTRDDEEKLAFASVS